MKIISKFKINVYPTWKQHFYIAWNAFKFHGIFVSLRGKCHFSVSRRDIFEWSHDWSTIQFSQLTG